MHYILLIILFCPTTYIVYFHFLTSVCNMFGLARLEMNSCMEWDRTIFSMWLSIYGCFMNLCHSSAFSNYLGYNVSWSFTHWYCAKALEKELKMCFLLWIIWIKNLLLLLGDNFLHPFLQPIVVCLTASWYTYVKC